MQIDEVGDHLDGTFVTSKRFIGFMPQVVGHRRNGVRPFNRKFRHGKEGLFFAYERDVGAVERRDEFEGAMVLTAQEPHVLL